MLLHEGPLTDPHIAWTAASTLMPADTLPAFPVVLCGNRLTPTVPPTPFVHLHLQEAKPYVEDGLHPQTIIKGYRTATQLLVKKIKELAIKVNKDNEGTPLFGRNQQAGIL